MLPTESRDSSVTTSQSDAPPLGVDPVGRRGRATALLSAGVLAVLGFGFASCSSNSPSVTTDSTVHQSGTTSKTISSVDLPKKWTVTWRFNCTNPVTARRFSLTATKSGGSPISITDQTGLGGGGTKTYAQTGTFDFAITTTCTWNLDVGPASSSPRTTTTVP